MASSANRAPRPWVIASRTAFCIGVLVLCSVPFIVIFSVPSASSSARTDNCLTALPSARGVKTTAENVKMSKHSTSNRLQQLRNAMKNLTVVPEALRAYVVPTDDAHQNEYIAATDQRRAYISGFTGSAGTVVVTESRAALWTDGRYWLQAANQLDENWELVKDRLPDSPTFGQWLNQHSPVNSVVGADPTTMSNTVWETLSADLESEGRRLIPVERNLVDLVWEGRPKASSNPICVLHNQYTGKDWRQKVMNIRVKMTEKKADFLVVTALDEIAWMLNMRGSDIPFNPVFFAYAIVGFDCVRLFLNSEKTTPAVMEHLDLADNNSMDTDMELVLRPYDAVFAELEEIVHQNPSKKVWVPPESSHAMFKRVPPKQLVRSSSPVPLMKAVKNTEELEGMFRCHVRDGIALSEFFSWLEKEVPRGNVTELHAAAKLEEFRSQQQNYVSLSFDTISASGPNGAIIHYKPTPESNRAITVNDMFLLDSGSQYLEGTTDVTRTVHMGTPTEYQKECYTRVLKGNLALAMSHFPNKTTGHRLDSFARHALWQVGLDYMHGTGHGVGSFLNVHEGPMSIGFRYSASDPGLEEGMVVTDEPGYYEASAFGIRIEDQLVVERREPKFGKEIFLGFRVLTMVPLQRKLLKPELLTATELERINQYHAVCMQYVGKALHDAGKIDAYRWLQTQTVSIG